MVDSLENRVESKAEATKPISNFSNYKNTHHKKSSSNNHLTSILIEQHQPNRVSGNYKIQSFLAVSSQALV